MPFEVCVEITGQGGICPMCNTTKQKIATTLRQMMTGCSFDKITVKNLMDATGMKRQSFYYHFQDTRDVLLWICREELFAPLNDDSREFSEWMLYTLSLLGRDRVFYRRVLEAAQMDFVRELGEQVLQPRVRTLLHGEEEKLDENQHFIVEFMANAMVDYYLRFVSTHKQLDLADCRRKMRYLVAQLKKVGE
jgi:AcrR family transcriptional regulator